MNEHQRPIAKVCIPHTQRDAFDYHIDDEKPSIGARVWVPFRHQVRLGIVIAIEPPQALKRPLKSILSVIDTTPLISDDILSLCFWISRYYQAPYSEVFPLALPKPYRLGREDVYPTQPSYVLNGSLDELLKAIKPQARRQRELVNWINQHPSPVSTANLIQAGFQTTHIKALLNQGLLLKKDAPYQPTPYLGPMSTPLTLHPEQAEALQTIQSQLNSYRCYVLKGVTGSGKTEVYLQSIASLLQRGKKALVLVPEIGLTPQLLARFNARFHQETIVVIHSNLNDSERQLAWQLANSGRASLVIGTRSAIFTPIPDLGLIIIDEEHDGSFKQMDGVRYSARDSALMRAHQANIPIILGSATPSLETLYNCELKKYHLLTLHNKAISNTPLQYQLLDIRSQPLEHGLAKATIAKIDHHLKQNHQVLIFINRRGFAPVLFCHQCAWIADCQHCDSHLTLHRSAHQLICHHCGASERVMTHCKQCHSASLHPIGTGTQRIYEALAEHFPTTSMLRMDRDELRGKTALDQALSDVSQGNIQLMVGTQLLAKGHHFPRLSLVVVLDADQGFYNQDFRALERLGQLITQVAGRAGRADIPGEVLIQTHLPHHPQLNQLIQDGYDAFANGLLASRKKASLPPYTYMALIRAQHQHQPKVMAFLTQIKQFFLNAQLEAMGPAPAPLPRKSKQHRMQLLLKLDSRTIRDQLLTALRQWVIEQRLGQNIRWSIDVDPFDLS